MQNTIEKNNNNKLDEIMNSDEYLQNKKNIDCIKTVLINHSDVPPKLLDWLIESVEQNTRLILKAEQNN